MIDEVILEEKEVALVEEAVRSNQNELGDSSSCSYTFGGAHDDDAHHIDIDHKHHGLIKVTPMMPGEGHEDIPSESAAAADEADIHSAAYS